MSIIKIYSELYLGQVANITFYPLTGGTIELGSHTIPYEYENQYYFGQYYLIFTGSNNTCILNISEPIPTQTPTPIPTITETPTQTPTPTPTNPCVEYLTDEFGDYILTEEGDFIISEINPCITPNPTKTPTTTPTTTDTPTLTPTPTTTLTPTNTETPTPTPTISFFTYNFTLCCLQGSITLYSQSSIIIVGSYLYSDMSLTTPYYDPTLDLLPGIALCYESFINKILTDITGLVTSVTETGSCN